MNRLEDAFSLYSQGGIYFEGARVDILKERLYLFVGLGGTGADALIHIKNQIHNRMKLPVDVDTGMPIGDIPTNVSFLAVDIDTSTEKIHYGNTSFADDGSDFLHIGSDDGTTAYEIANEMLNDKHNGEKYAQWLNDNMPSINVDNCPGARRTIGRIAFFHNFRDIEKTINDKLYELSLKNPTAENLVILLFTGLSGGTGSGIFLDMGYLLKEICGKYNDHSSIHGYFLCQMWIFILTLFLAVKKTL